MMGSGFEPILITSEADGARVGAALKAVKAEVKIMREGGFAIALLKGRSGLWRTRRKLGAALVARQRALEAAHGAAPILAVAPGARLDRASALSAFVAANGALLEEGLLEFGDREQHQVTIDLPFDAALARMRAAPGWAEIAAAGRDARSAADKRAFGARLASEAERLGRALGARAEEALRRAALDAEVLPPGEETTALNIVVLTERDGGAEIEQALEAIDADWSGALRIRLLGPSPATSFASVLIEETDLKSAADTLGVTPTATRDEIDAAYRKVMRVAHPDHAGESATARAAEISAATRLLRRSADARGDVVSAALVAHAAAAPLARLYRDGGRIGEG